MRGLVIVGLLAATVLPVGASAQLSDGERQDIMVYTAEAGMVLDLVSGTFEDLGPLGDAFLEDMTDRQALNRIMAETGVFEAAYEAALEIDAPPLVMEAHAELMDGLELLNEAAPVMREGFEAMDPATLDEATGLLQESNGHIQEATRLLQEATAEIG